MPATTCHVPGLSGFIDDFDGFIIDQWGVLHDGATPYPGVMDVLAELRARGKRIVLLTNSGRRTVFNRQRMEELGFDLSVLDGIVTSGEATWLALHNRPAPFDSLGRRCLLITRTGDHGPVEGLDIELASGPEDADFIYLSWLEGDMSALEPWREMARRAVARNLPMVCSNPDRVAVGPQGIHLAPGTVAALYEEMGGKVIYVGKPMPPIYDACLDLMPGIPRERIVCIGDSMEHDIKGANTMGMGSAFVMGGIHAELFTPHEGDPAATMAALDELAARFDARPDFMIPTLRL